jgi:hypothetical protein
MAQIPSVRKRNAWRFAIRKVGVLFVAFGLGNFAYTIFQGVLDKPVQVLLALFLAIFLMVAGLLAVDYSIETEEEEDEEQIDAQFVDRTSDEGSQSGKVSVLAETHRSVGQRLRDAIYEPFRGSRRDSKT